MECYYTYHAFGYSLRASSPGLSSDGAEEGEFTNYVSLILIPPPTPYGSLSTELSDTGQSARSGNEREM